ncbi:MAG: PQQ-like beta-propeller repeat protein [Pirellulales bacterium]|nr:PQQ-like beta-propeller repeat protein [Pirellulales bacterium]
MARTGLLVRSTGAACWLACVLAAPACAQFMIGTPNTQLSDAVVVEEADAAARTHLEQARALFAASQWDEGIETLRQVMENYGDKLTRLTPQRYVTVREYCQRLIAGLPPAALSLYRSRVDAQAQSLYESGSKQRDARRLRDVAEQYFCSSWGDDGLMTLGELALADGDFGTARACWQQLVPNGELPGHPDAFTRLAVPDTQFDLALVRSRLVLASIAAGDRERAVRELDQFRQLHPQARGRLAGRDVSLAEGLTQLLEEAAAWPAAPRISTWSTFAGNAERNAVLAGEFDVAARLWEAPLRAAQIADANLAQNYGFRPRRVAEDNKALLSYYPLVYRDLILVNDEQEIQIFDLRTGRAPWGMTSHVLHAPDSQSADRSVRPRRMLGTPRFTMTISDGRLYARMGSALTSVANEPLGIESPGTLVCRDLEAQGRLLWERPPDELGWAFEGTPVASGNFVYVAMRRAGVQPQTHVACYEAVTGRPVWRQMVCGADTPAHNQVSEASHNLLTLHGDTVYYNTNLGAVAALDAGTGRIRWLTLYPRARGGNLNDTAAHFYRDLTPCLYYQGLLLVAPADSPAILALDADSGQLLWESSLPEDVVHLLGVAGGNLIASGDRLWWISLAQQEFKIIRRVPEDHSLRGYGRGLLVGDQVIWPTREEILVFDSASGQQLRSISLAARREWDGTAVIGGNLLVTPEHLLIAGPDKLVVFSQFAATRPRATPAAFERRAGGQRTFVPRKGQP